MTNPTRVICFCLLLSLCIGCRKTSGPTQSVAAPPAAPQAELNHSGGGNAVASETKYFKGSIGSSLDLQMKLVRSGDQLTGNYYYQKIGTKIELKGNVDKDGTLLLEEFDPSHKQTGVFKGLWMTNAEDGLITIAGNWSKPPGEKGGDKKTAFSIHEEPIVLTGGAEVITKQIKESNKRLMYEVEIQYPQLSGGSNPNFEKFNQAVRAAVTKKTVEFKKEIIAPEGEEPPPAGSMGSDLTVSYKVALVQDDLASINLAVGSYYQGAAHPNSYSEVINYDLKNGKLLRLADLFKSGAKYLPAISAYCISDLSKQAKAKGPDGMLDDNSIKNGAAATPKNYQSWIITKRGLGINFDAYQVGPYAAGPQYVLVPYSALKDLINPDGLVGQFAK